MRHLIDITIVLFVVSLMGSGACLATIHLPATSDNIPTTYQRFLSSDPSDASSGTVIQHWRVNSWGTPPATYAFGVVDPTVRHADADVANYFRLDQRGTGDAQLTLPFTLKKGKLYVARLRLRAAVPTLVSVGFRRDVPDYEYFAYKSVTLTPTWQDVEIEGWYTGRDNDSGGLRVVSRSLGVEIEIKGATLGTVQTNRLALINRSNPPAPPFFGIVVNRLGTHDQWPQMRPDLIRLWDTGTTWALLEPQQGRWNFQRLALYTGYAMRNDSEILYTLGQTPDWAGVAGQQKCEYGHGCLPMRSEQLWRDHVTAMFKRFGAQIHYWELWNEPDYHGFWSGTPEGLAKLSAILRNVQQQESKQAYLVGPGVTVSGGLPFLDRFLSEGGGVTLDAFGCHIYYNADADGLAETIDNFRHVLQAHHLGNLPIWITEGAPQAGPSHELSTNENDREIDLESTNFKALLIMRAMGVAHFSFYNYETSWPEAQIVERGNPAKMTVSGKALVAAIAIARTAKILDSYEFSGVFVIRFFRDGKIRTALWSGKGDQDVQLPDDWHIAKALPWLRTDSIPVGSNGQLRVGRRPLLLE